MGMVSKAMSVDRTARVAVVFACLDEAAFTIGSVVEEFRWASRE